MGLRTRISSRFLPRPVDRSQQGTSRFKRLALRLEQCEPRLLMAGDGAGFVNTNPDADPDSVIGVAGVEAKDDYFKRSTNTSELRFDVLANDSLPTGSENFRIRSVSETLRGATVSISDDGQRIVYFPDESTTSFDTFYYIVEDNEGNLGKANVNVRARIVTASQSTVPSFSGSNSYTVYEDGPERTLNVLLNDGPFRNGEIIELETRYGFGSSIRIADDGKSLVYQPAPGIVGYEAYEYTVRNQVGETATLGVSITIEKPFATNKDKYDFSPQPGPYFLDVLANDRLQTPTSELPRIVEVPQTLLGGSLSVSDDGQQVVFTPDEGFVGSFTFAYTVRYGPEDHQTVKGLASVNVDAPFLAVSNWYAIDPGSSNNRLDVLGNDPLLDYDNGPFRRRSYTPRLSYGDDRLTIVAVNAASQGGQLRIENGRAIRYTPQAGFVGEETFTYVVEDSNGNRDSATVTLQIAPTLVDPTGVPRFISPGELEQFLIDQAVERYAGQFGEYASRFLGTYDFFDNALYPPSANIQTLAMTSTAAIVDTIQVFNYSQTNTQEAGIDEADIVETDGRYIYTLSRGKLVIADLANPANPLLVSVMEFDDRYTEMYLQGDRITLIQRGGYVYGDYSDGFQNRGGDGLIAMSFTSSFVSGKLLPAVVTVLDISDRTSPTVVERTEIDGKIIDSRAVGDQVYLTVSGLNLPELKFEILGDPDAPRSRQLRLNETLDEYVARVRETLLAEALPSYRTLAGDGTLLAAGLLTDPTLIHKPLDNLDSSLLSLVTFDVGDDQPGPLASIGIFASARSQVYMSGDSFYVMQGSRDETTILKFSIADDGTPSLVATGKVGGNLLNQFSVDEYDGRFRIATTQVVRESYIDQWGNERFRQQQRFNNLFVLQQRGATLEIVGSVENLAPTERIKSVRFMDDVAYVVTFRVVDPLFVIDLSDATNPTVEGSLKIPGFSSYLQPVGEDYVIGIGRDANEITGRLGSLQVSLFYVGDMTNPTLVDQVTMEGARWVDSEAWRESLAVAYFPESQILTLPVSWYSKTEFKNNGSWSSNRQSAIWTFQIDVDQQGGGSLTTTGSVEHEGQARRSIRLGTSLVTISQDYIKVNNLLNVGEQLAVLDLGELLGSGHTIIQNGRVIDLGETVPLSIATAQPDQGFLLAGWNVSGGGAPPVGSVDISQVDRALVYTPRDNLLDTALLANTVFDAARNAEFSRFEGISPETHQHSRKEAAIDTALEDWGDENELALTFPAQFLRL